RLRAAQGDGQPRDDHRADRPLHGALVRALHQARLPAFLQRKIGLGEGRPAAPRLGGASSAVAARGVTGRARLLTSPRLGRARCLTAPCSWQAVNGLARTLALPKNVSLKGK